MNPGATLPAGHQLAGHVLRRVLGSGSHGTVYLASPSGTTQAVAMKVLSLNAGAASSATSAAFLDTAAAWRTLRHRDAITVLDAGIDQGLAWLTMEVVPGSDLCRYTRAPRLLPEALSIQICQRVAQVLAHAHRRGLVHRDVKPANVLVHWPTQTVKLGDFGLARLADAANTATGMMLGSPSYMAPELLAGSAPTPRSDLYALGVTLFELLTGRQAFDGPNMGALLRNISQHPPPLLRQARPDLPEALESLLQLLLSKTPVERPADGDQLAQRLGEILAQLPRPPST